MAAGRVLVGTVDGPPVDRRAAGRLGRHRDAAVLEGAVRATPFGHRIFGADEAALNELSAQLRTLLGDEAYGKALREGAALDGDAAVEHALQAL